MPRASSCHSGASGAEAPRDRNIRSITSASTGVSSKASSPPNTPSVVRGTPSDICSRGGRGSRCRTMGQRA